MTISAIIPTWNEVAHIGSLVSFILDHGKNDLVEVIVVDGGSSDRTVEAAAQAGATVLSVSLRNRAHQMNEGAKHARGEVLYFIHADVRLVSSFAKDIQTLVDEGFDSGCYRYVFDSRHPMLRLNGYCTRFNRIMCRGGDQTLFVKKVVFEDLGGFSEYYSIMEDFDFIIRLQKKFRFKIIPKNIVVSARKYETNSWLRVQLANLTVFIMFFLKQPPERMRLVYKKLLHYR